MQDVSRKWPVTWISWRGKIGMFQRWWWWWLWWLWWLWWWLWWLWWWLWWLWWWLWWLWWWLWWLWLWYEALLVAVCCCPIWVICSHPDWGCARECHYDQWRYLLRLPYAPFAWFPGRQEDQLECVQHCGWQNQSWRSINSNRVTPRHWQIWLLPFRSFRPFYYTWS